MYSKLTSKIRKPFMWVQLCQQTTHLYLLVYVSLLFCKTCRLNGLWLYTSTWITIRLVQCYFVLKIEKGSTVVSSTRIVLWKEDVAAHWLPFTLFSLECLWIYCVSPFTQLDGEYQNINYSAKPNYDFKHTRIPLCGVDEVCMCVQWDTICTLYLTEVSKY